MKNISIVKNVASRNNKNDVCLTTDQNRIRIEKYKNKFFFQITNTYINFTHKQHENKLRKILKKLFSIQTIRTSERQQNRNSKLTKTDNFADRFWKTKQAKEYAKQQLNNRNLLNAECDSEKN